MNSFGQGLSNIFWADSSAKKYLLVIVAHPDDFEISCLGTVLKLHESDFNFTIKLLTFCTDSSIRKKEQKNSISDLKKLGINIDLISFNYIDTTLFDNINEIKKDIRKYEEEISILGGEVCVITHHKNDRHQDHLCVNNAVTQTLRKHRIITFYILKYEEENFNASFYVSLNKNISWKKADHIMKNFPSQHNKNWFNKEVFLSQMRVQGVHSNCEFSEVFSIEKMRV